MRVWVFAVEPDRVQVCWRAMGPGAVTLAVGDDTIEVVTDGGPGAVVLRGLDAGGVSRHARGHRRRCRGPGLGHPPPVHHTEAAPR